jgi:hypothetical protein
MVRRGLGGRASRTPLEFLRGLSVPLREILNHACGMMSFICFTGRLKARRFRHGTCPLYRTVPVRLAALI